MHSTCTKSPGYPSRIEGHHGALLDEPGQHFIERAGAAHDVPAVELHHRFVAATDALGLLMPRSAVAYRRIASRLLSERGLAAVWQLHLDALSAHLKGYAGAAALMLAIADAAEEIVWWRTQVSEITQRGL